MLEKIAIVGLIIIVIINIVSEIRFRIKVRRIKAKIKEIEDRMEKAKWNKFIEDLWTVRNKE